jgi:GntR family transcriptional regulator, rspAB operon transcriptional repressor
LISEGKRFLQSGTDVIATWAWPSVDRGRGTRLFDLLRSEIIATRLTPGQALSEKEIAVRYGVSRQPVREAFIKLADAGLLHIVPSKGSYVSKISMRTVVSAQFVREAVECALVEAAARRIAPEQQATLESSLAQQRAAIATSDQPLFNELDQSFHRAIARIADCAYASPIIEAARAETDRLRRLAIPQAVSRHHLVLQQHEAICDRLVAGDPAGAAAAMRLHLREILKALPAFAKANPELFEEGDARQWPDIAREYDR